MAMVPPPVTTPHRRAATSTHSVRLDAGAVERLYQSAWFLCADVLLAVTVTTWTLEVAATRADERPRPDLVDAWLVTIADRELTRLRSAGKLPTPSLPTSPSHGTDLGWRLAQALQQLEPTDRLALVMRYRLGASLTTVAMATGCTARSTRGRIRWAATRAATALGAPVSSLVTAEAPPAELPGEVIPLDRQPGAGRLDYSWLDSGFPTETTFEGRSRRRLIVGAAVAVLALAALVGLDSRPTHSRPYLVDEPPPPVSTVAGDTNTAGLPRLTPAEPLT